jgi:hypothetical protein
MLRMSQRTLDRKRARGEVLDPMPGNCYPRWSRVEVERWLAAGAPRADEWRRRKRK